MPKIEIDYSNTVFYKIFCKDANVSDLYVGHTTNFVQRKHAHKQGCKNPKSSNYNCKLYNAIRLHGGWDNWIMEIIAFNNCNDHYEARIKEQEYFVSCKATLNSIEPMPKPKPKPTKNVFDTSELSAQQIKLCCVACNYHTCRESQYNRHIETSKHITRTQISKNNSKQAITEYTCECGKQYSHASSLWNHKQKCTNKNQCNTEISITKPLYNESTVMELLKQNNEFKSLILEQHQQIIEQNKQIIELIKSNNK